MVRRYPPAARRKGKRLMERRASTIIIGAEEVDRGTRKVDRGSKLSQGTLGKQLASPRA